VAEIARYIEANGAAPAGAGRPLDGRHDRDDGGARYPDRVGKVMVVDMTAAADRNVWRDRGLAARSRARDLIQDPGGRRLLSGLITAFSPPEEGGRQSDPDVVARAMHDLGTIDLTGDLPRLRAPLTVVYAVRNQEAAAATGRAFADAYRGARGARLVPVPDSGHLIMVDQPGRFAKALREFLG
jgi:N-formylmaleamate deformylase